MSGIFSVLDIARKGLSASQAGVKTAGHNIANANTPGFSRQRQIQTSDTPILTSAGIQGSGVRVIGVERITDPFIQAQEIRQGSVTASADAQANILSLVEGILNEQGSPGLTSALGEFYDALGDLATSSAPGAPAERVAVVASAQAAVDTLNVLDSRLRDVMVSTNEAIKGLIPRVNVVLDEINSLNLEIARVEIDPASHANDQRDQRDLLMRELSGYLNINYYERSTGAIDVSLVNGIALVEGGRARSLTTTVDPTNTFNLGIVRIEVQDLSSVVDVTSQIGGGEIGGLLRSRDTALPGAIRDLDTIAYNLAVSVNTIHAGGVGLTGAVGNFFAALPQVEDAARDLTIAANIVANPDDIAAGLTSAAGDNRNALALAALRDQQAPLFLPGDPPGPATGPSRSVIDHAVVLIADVGQQSRTAASASGLHSRIAESLANRRDQVSGVSIDEEVTNLIRLQAAFQANSRVVSVVQRMLDDLLNIL